MTQNKLKRQKEIEQVLLANYSLEEPKSMDELAGILNMRNRSSVYYHISKLIKHGKLILDSYGQYRTNSSAAHDIQNLLRENAALKADKYKLEKVLEEMKGVLLSFSN